MTFVCATAVVGAFVSAAIAPNRRRNATIESKKILIAGKLGARFWPDKRGLKPLVDSGLKA
jgi:hypothetical protein